MRVALGASENALGRLRPTLLTLKGSIEAERKTSFTLSSCLMGSTKEKKFTPSEGIRSLKFEELSDFDISHSRGGFIALHLLGTNGLPLQTPSNKLVGSST